MATKKRPSRLGRGLSSLMAQPVAVKEEAKGTDTARATAPPSSPEKSTQASKTTSSKAAVDEPTAPATAADGLHRLPIKSIRPNPHQPRQTFDEGALQRLADSIAREGIMQPIVVRPTESEKGGQPAYELVAGERRWRAAQLAKLDVVPAIVRELDNRQLAEWALIENLQREDLNPIERAQAFQRLIDQFSLRHDDVAQRVGVERSTVSNSLRLLNLDDYVQKLLLAQTLSMGQARAIAGLSDTTAQRQVAERAVRQGLSVRQVEQLVRKLAETEADGGDTDPGEASAGQRRVRSAYLADLEQQLAEQLETRVRIRPGRKKGSGTLSVEFYSLEQFDGLMERLGVQTE
ncbi:ParB/RepB/Spo0J family partition protein [Phycisphaerales bacterium AB-hyl4]|uniref:ParB/RepB/Spo0J family partition protein n=1 Tax=Natronomicrosphaera hydrolytica TaxID=3242702 RepID=A0ABV4U6J2_9BACT